MLNQIDNDFVSNYSEILRDLGYVFPQGQEVRTNALWRGGKSLNSISLNFNKFS